MTSVKERDDDPSEPRHAAHPRRNRPSVASQPSRIQSLAACVWIAVVA